jgi:hypothetical protein
MWFSHAMPTGASACAGWAAMLATGFRDVRIARSPQPSNCRMAQHPYEIGDGTATHPGNSVTAAT